MSQLRLFKILEECVSIDWGIWETKNLYRLLYCLSPADSSNLNRYGCNYIPQTQHHHTHSHPKKRKRGTVMSEVHGRLIHKNLSKGKDRMWQNNDAIVKRYTIAWAVPVFIHDKKKMLDFGHVHQPNRPKKIEKENQ